jgi:hypothetical protein
MIPRIICDREPASTPGERPIDCDAATVSWMGARTSFRVQHISMNSRKRSKLPLAALACIALLSTACGAEFDAGTTSPSELDEEGEVLDDMEAALRQSATPTYVNCSGENLTIAQNAYGLVRARLWNTSSRIQFVACTMKAVFSATYTYPEQLLQLLREDVPTTIECVSGSSTNANPETIYLGAQDFETAKSREANQGQPAAQIMADVLIHELAHTKGRFLLPRGNGHPGPACGASCIEHQLTVTNNVSSCLLDIIPHDWSFDPAPHFIPDRDVMATATGEVTLMPVGTVYGHEQADENICFLPEKGIGIVGRSGSSLNALGMYCRNMSDGVEGANGATGGAGTAFSFKCPANEVLIGFRGRVAASLDAIQPVCALSSSVAAGGTSTNVPTPPTFGASGPVTFERMCPAFQVVKGVRLRTSDVVRRMDVLCQRHDLFRDSWSTPGTLLGGTGGAAMDDEHCPSRSVMDKLWGVGDDANNGLLRLGAGCTKVTTACHGCQVTVSGGSNNVNHMLPFRGFQPVEGTGVGLTGQCSGTDGVLVGLTTWRSSGAVRAVRGICATASLWSNGSSTTTFDTAQVGTPPAGSVAQSFTCPARSFLTGWRIVEDPNLMSITPRCRTF